MSQEVIQRVTGLVRAFDARVQATPADSWDNQSPCAEWKARDVVVHVGNNLNGMGARLSGIEPHVITAGEDIVAAWDSARDLFLGVIPTADLSTSLPGPFGPMPAADLIGRLVCTDVLVHTWDLARAVGGDESLHPGAVAGAYSGLKPMDEMIRKPGVFGPRIDVSDTDLQTEFLSFLGRKV
ncbi:MAG: TIGR03086 family metal-binding protein [Actinomycetota bacterium]